MPPPDPSRAKNLERWLAAVHQWLRDGGSEHRGAQLAAGAGISPSHLNNLLSGRRQLLPRHVAPLGRAIGLDAREIEVLASMLRGAPSTPLAPEGVGVLRPASDLDLERIAENRSLLRSARPEAWAARAWVWTLPAADARHVFEAGEAAFRTRTAVQNSARIRVLLRAFPVTKIDSEYSAEADFSPALALISPPGGATVNLKMKTVAAEEEPDVLDFLDYRDFLVRYLDAARARNHRLSKPWLGQRLGVSGAQIANILARRRKLDPATAAAATGALGLQGERADYFGLLVEYNDTTDALGAIQAWRRLCVIRSRHGRTLEDRASSVLLMRWYMPVVLELSMQPGWRENPTWIAARICPRITPAQAADAVALLRAAGFLAGRPDGVVPVARTAQWLNVQILARFHDECLDAAADAARLGLEPWQYAEADIDVPNQPGACAQALLGWRTTIEEAARTASSATPSMDVPAHLFLAHAFLVDTPPP